MRGRKHIRLFKRARDKGRREPKPSREALSFGISDLSLLSGVFSAARSRRV